MLRGKPFDRTATFQIEEVERAMDQVGLDEPRSMPCVLFAPNYANRSPTNKSSRVVGEFHSKHPVSVARPAHQDGDASTVFTNANLLNRVLDQNELGKLDAAIVSPNIELVTKLANLGVPSLCLYNDPQDVSALRRLHARFPNLPLLFAQQSDSVQVKLSLNTLIHRNAHRKRCILPLRLEGLIWRDLHHELG